MALFGWHYNFGPGRTDSKGRHEGSAPTIIHLAWCNAVTVLTLHLSSNLHFSLNASLKLIDRFISLAHVLYSDVA